MKALQRSRRCLLVFGIIYLLSLLAYKVGEIGDLAVWFSMLAIAGMVLSAFFAIIFQIVWTLRKKAGHG